MSESTEAVIGENGQIGGNAREMLKGFKERIERLEEEKKAIADDIRDVYAEAKGNGFDTKVLRRIISDGKKDRNELAEFEAVLDTYRHALGLLADLPLGQAALAQAAIAKGQQKRERKGQDADA